MAYDVAIIGLGAMGSSAAYALASRGSRVIAFDALSPPHALGSTHGHTRIIREAYYEHPLYVPLVRRAYELWGALDHESDARLLTITGGVMVGPEDGPLVRGAVKSALTHGIEHEMLDSRALSERFPAYRAHDDWVALFEKRAGFLNPERCVTAMLDRARHAGATIHFNEEVTHWRASGQTLIAQTRKERYEVRHIVVAAGPWIMRLRESLDVTLPLEIERQLSHWFEPESDDDRYRPRRCPVALWEPRRDEIFITLPDDGHGVKCGMHHAGATTTPDKIDRQVSHDENEGARRFLLDVMPGAGGKLRDARVCLYTNTPDRHFIIDRLQNDRVVLLSPCSGHGFKFASAIGEIAAQLVLDGKSWLDLKPFALSRFH